MEINHLNSLRLGFSTQQSETINKMGISAYVANQLKGKDLPVEPSFLKGSPKSQKEYAEFRKKKKDDNAITKELNRLNLELKSFLIKRCNETAFPLQEKINLLFQNHFVVTMQSVKIPYWIYQHYKTISTHSLGNYKTLVKEMVYSNAMIKYLDNQQNKKEKINENLGRELLELFTLGEGNYTENDIKNTALALAGLSYGEEKGEYRRAQKNNSQKTVFGKSGDFIIDDVIDIIFEQKNTAYFLAEKCLKWFFYDNPSEELIIKYGDILKESQFELKPFFQQLFTEECSKTKGGNQIKNPLVFFLQIFNDLNLKYNYKLLAFFLKNQAMDIYDQPNVKGWEGGKNWLTSQIYADRNQIVEYFISGNKKFKKVLKRRLEKLDIEPTISSPSLQLKNKTDAKSIIDELTQKMVFETNEEMLTELNLIINHDFDPNAKNSEKSILKVYQYLATTPEFQII